MEGVRTFLESSTIHGLGYISTTRRLVKLFWIVIVIAGFTGAGILIYKSFQDWDENPVTTTVETQSIRDITFPKVTVCPPKNTYTNLNYDLMMLENSTLDNEIRKELAYFGVELIQDHIFEEVMFNLSVISESNRFYNWYHGYSEINLPFWGQETDSRCTDASCKQVYLRYRINTLASSGSQGL